MTAQALIDRLADILALAYPGEQRADDLYVEDVLDLQSAIDRACEEVIEELDAAAGG